MVVVSRSLSPRQARSVVPFISCLLSRIKLYQLSTVKDAGVVATRMTPSPTKFRVSPPVSALARGASLVLTVAALTLACGGNKKSATSASGGCDESIKLPTGFCAIVFAESAGPVRDVVVRKNGDVFVGLLDQRRQPGGVLALRDTNKDGHADIAERFGAPTRPCTCRR